MSATIFATRVLVVGLDRVAALDARPLDARELGLEREHGLRVGRGVRPAGEREDLLEVLLILRADVDEALDRAQVVVAIGQRVPPWLR